VIGRAGLSPGEFSYPRAIAVSPVDGRIFVVDKTARIQRFSPHGAYEHQWRMPACDNGKPTGLTVDDDNRVWVADTHYARVIVFDRDGSETMRFGRRGEGSGEFVFPTSIAIDRDGFIYVGEYGGNDRISKFTPDGSFVTAFADKAAGHAWVERPAGLAFDENDELWLTDICHHRICRFSKGGDLLLELGGPGDREGELSFPYGLALEPGGTLLVADRGNNRIVRFRRDGAFVASWGAAGRAVGQIAQPWGVAVAAGGGVYCLDSWNNRVQLIDW
jgi:DNA-binding beta-propeller fold protein YncE